MQRYRHALLQLQHRHAVQPVIDFQPAQAAQVERVRLTVPQTQQKIPTDRALLVAHPLQGHFQQPDQSLLRIDIQALLLLKPTLSAGIAAVAAQPSLPALGVGQKAVAVGTGSFNGKNAVGLAMAFSPAPGVALAAGVSTASGAGSLVVKTSASYTW